MGRIYLNRLFPKREKPQTPEQEVRSEYLRYLIPTIVGMVAQAAYCLADVFFVGIGVGSDGLAALNVALPVFTIYSTFSVMLGVGAATTISICRGRGEEGLADQVFTIAMGTLVMVGIALSLIGVFFLEEIALLFGATQRIAPMVVEYLRPIAPVCVVFMLSSTLSIIVRADGNPHLVMTAGMVGNSANIILDYVFVIPMDMGVFGAGLATAVGPMLSCALLTLHFVRRYNKVHFVRSCFHPKLLIRVFRNGVGSGVLEVSSGFVILLFNVCLLRVSGETAVAVFSIISNIGYVGKGIFNGMAQAAQPIISVSYGARWYKRMGMANRDAMLTALFFSLGVYVLLFLFPRQMVSLFVSSEPEVVTMGAIAVVLYFISLPFTGMNTILMYYFQSIERSLCTFAIAILRGILLVWAALELFSRLWGLHGVWLALTAAEAITFLAFFPVERLVSKKLLAKENQAQTD